MEIAPRGLPSPSPGL